MSTLMEQALRNAIDDAARAEAAIAEAQAEVDAMQERIRRAQAAVDLDLGAFPDRILRAAVECEQRVGDEDDWSVDLPCPFAGEVDVVIFDDTREALWECPSCGRQNNARPEMFA